ncbi:hypothetical protein IQ255_15675 [Pleurocapsales cyanobacterium LEGE 10410]|nr:hypothetical protein [Pleurocapsales cyanobacterium LEGE 10410]
MGLSQRQLCEYFGWDYRTIAQEAKAKKLSTHEYVQQKTGWILREEVYYPPFNHSEAIEANHSFNN